MTAHDIMMVLVMTFPMFLFSIYPGIVVSNFLEKKYGIEESKKRAVMIGVTFLFALTLSLLLYYV
ncbi:hypothetical protein [Sulfurimonas paralvinellae]|uniref:Uncharacterized protein n=1 Tax=Sulfurimonas paralvinellae TaxID=317658 RepID=A0A7M1B6S0_9BACT|nr:hypothetical protein [Sulfurimonas paralvinellae]QOP45391.1 hypothetical protein FM071_03500 [Sulfurimonas paralvinellae]